LHDEFEGSRTDDVRDVRGAGPRRHLGVQGAPAEVVTSTISGLLPTDLVEPAGYPSTADEANVRVVRDGKVVATYHLFPDEHGGWYIDSATACDGTDLASLGSGGGVSGATGASGSTGSDLPLCASNTGANGGPDGTQLHLLSQNITFDTSCLNAPAGTSFAILFDNLDPGVPKNIAIYPMKACATGSGTAANPAGSCPAAGSKPVFTGKMIDGTGNGAEIVYQVGPLDAGTYYFQDDIHPGENGVLIVA
jgi:hypothetical protein